jgi:hypothetical protein
MAHELCFMDHIVPWWPLFWARQREPGFRRLTLGETVVLVRNGHVSAFKEIFQTVHDSPQIA